MPRNMSFMLTKEQIINKTKTVTRRVGWAFLKVGDILNACEKCQGLKKGDKINKLCQIKVTSTGLEPLNKISYTEVIREGFEDLSPAEFISFFIKSHKGTNSDSLVNRIEFEYL